MFYIPFAPIENSSSYKPFFYDWGSKTEGVSTKPNALVGLATILPSFMS